MAPLHYPSLCRSYSKAQRSEPSYGCFSCNPVTTAVVAYSWCWRTQVYATDLRMWVASMTLNLIELFSNQSLHTSVLCPQLEHDWSELGRYNYSANSSKMTQEYEPGHRNLLVGIVSFRDGTIHCPSQSTSHPLCCCWIVKIEGILLNRTLSHKPNAGLRWVPRNASPKASAMFLLFYHESLIIILLNYYPLFFI